MGTFPTFNLKIKEESVGVGAEIELAYRSFWISTLYLILQPFHPFSNQNGIVIQEIMRTGMSLKTINFNQADKSFKISYSSAPWFYSRFGFILVFNKNIFTIKNDRSKNNANWYKKIIYRQDLHRKPVVIESAPSAPLAKAEKTWGSIWIETRVIITCIYLSLIVQYK